MTNVKDRQIPESGQPLSPLQMGMLVHSIDVRGAYVQQLVGTLSESIDALSFERAWQQTVDTYPILRTQFRWEGLEEPVQSVSSEMKCPFTFRDLSALAAPQKVETFDTFLKDDRRSAFSEGGPMLRVNLFKIHSEEYKMVWTFHHALLDGRSHYLVLKNAFDSYDSLRDEISLANEKVTEADQRYFFKYVDWQRSQDYTSAAEFWRESLADSAGGSTLNVLPVDIKSEYPVQSRSFVQESLGPSETCRLREIAKQNGVTLNNFVQAAWGIVLARYSNESEVIFGATRSCRHWTDEDISDAAGLFINTLPLRVSVKGDRSLISWLQELRSLHVRLRDYEHTPLPKIPEYVGLPGGHPLFESVLVFEDYQLNERLRTTGAKWEKREFNFLEQT